MRSLASGAFVALAVKAKRPPLPMHMLVGERTFGSFTADVSRCRGGGCGRRRDSVSPFGVLAARADHAGAEPVWTVPSGSKKLGRPFSIHFQRPHSILAIRAKVWMVNFRVRDLDKIAAQLQAAGIAVKVYPQSYPDGRSSGCAIPQGNPIELWQPEIAENFILSAPLASL